MSDQAAFDDQRARAFLSDLFRVAIDAALPDKMIAGHLPEPPRGRTIVLGAGKASAAMARAVERAWPGELTGLVVTRYDHAVPCQQIEIVEASHPTPDDNGLAAARRIRDMAEAAGPDDLVLFLISGGGSSLLSLPADGLTLDDKIAVNNALLSSGADIGEMNVVRKHISAIKGGQLAAAAAPARCVTLTISDVPGDDLSAIASGPTVPDPSTFAEARAIVERYGMKLPANVNAHLDAAAVETPKADHACFAGSQTTLIASPMGSLQAAAAAAREAGVTPLILGDALEGEARELGTGLAGIALSARSHGVPVRAPAVLLSGGETTVTVRNKGKGGRNTEYLAGLALTMAGAPDIYALAGDTDGIDGSEDNAGAIVTPDTLARARAAGLDLHAALAGNNVYPYFAALGDLVVTGPTLTNVNDFRAILIGAPAVPA